MTSVLLATPPLLEPNNPYPATTHLTGFLRGRGITAHQVDLSILLVTRLLSRAFLPLLRQAAEDYAATQEEIHPTVAFFLAAYADYERAIDPVMAFLQGKDPILAHRIASRSFCPEGPYFAALEGQTQVLEQAFGELALQDRAKYLAARFLTDLANVITVTIDPHFTPWKYGLELVGPDFRPLAAKLAREPSLIDRELLGLWTPILEKYRPDLVCLTAPFAGTCYGALRLGKAVREILPATRIALGGGFVGSQLRDLDEPAVFEFVDYIVLDAGERPLERLIEHLEGRLPETGLHRTWVREKGRVTYRVQENLTDIPHKQLATPTYASLPLDRYFSMTAYPNPNFRLWTDLRWNKLALAHGCYWKRCAFCETSLDYIRRYDPTPAERVVDRMEQLAAQTDWTGFYLVDAAAPPKLLKALSRVLLARGLCFTWLTDIRFERAFENPELTDLMARAGCICVSGGLETASNRLLALMDKGTTVEQTARACRSLTRSGISVHTYLIYGFPTETEQETLENLERVRQLFALGYIQSAAWSPFSLTVYSPLALNPDRYGIRPRFPARGKRTFTHHIVPYENPAYDYELLDAGLRRAGYHFNRGLGLDRDVRSWFSKPFDPPQVAPDFIRAVAPPDERTDPHHQWRPAGLDWKDQPRHGLRVPSCVVVRAEGEDLALLNLSDDTSYRFEGIGAECWRLLAVGHSVAEIVEAIARTYSAPRELVSADIAALIDELCENGLLQRDYEPVGARMGVGCGERGIP